MPKISVIMPVYNEQRYLKDAIESILNQTFTDFAFIIIDDGSVDDSSEIIKSYQDTRIRFFRSEKKGMAEQFNFGIVNSSTPLIARMDADDIAIKNRFEVQYKYLSSNPDIHIVGSNIEYINEEGKSVGEKKYPELHDDIEFMMPIESAVCHPVTIMRREIFDKIGLYNTEYDYSADHALFLNIIYSGYKFYNLQEILLKYRPRIIRPDMSRVGNSNMISYKLGIDYLNRLNIESSHSSNKYSYYFRMGLIEYYRGSLSLSRKYFIKAWMNSKNKMFKILRYFSVTLFGQRFIDFLRKSSLLPRFSLYLNKITKFDLHRIRK
jgi:glycosyltransferase involved in cell wall biosynthesis